MLDIARIWFWNNFVKETQTQKDEQELVSI